MMTRQRAFTLIEIAVVLGILFILAALLFGVFARVRENGRTTTCQSNLHQLYLALSQYVADNDSHFPNYPWKRRLLLTYAKSETVFLCPNVSRPLPPDAPVNWTSDYKYRFGLFESLSFAPSSTGLPIPKIKSADESVIVDPSKVPVFEDYPMDKGIWVDLPRGAACGWTYADGAPRTSYRYTDRHQGGFNVSFYDGHIKWMTPEQGAEVDCDAGRYAQPPYRAGGPHLSK